ncbi:collagen alpha-1(II) chain-like [Corvus kubaryi]|uniref:collagen alpha-1(II) chain-like n=1 Tax=Corvus kubaryi TaxID=68294 RepID=UPI001C050B8E|nr:collagen alpha-1(II) chain-like [Corvus kubaryi]
MVSITNRPATPTSHRLNKPDQNLPVFLILQWKAKERGRGQGQCSSKEDRSRKSPAVLSPSAAELGWPGEPRLTAAGAPAGALAPAVPAKRSHRSREGGTTQRSNYPAIQRSSSSRALPASPGCSGTAPQQAWREPRPGSAERGRAGRAVTLGLAESVGSDRRRESAGWPWERGAKKLWRPSVLRKDNGLLSISGYFEENLKTLGKTFKDCKTTAITKTNRCG